MKSCCFALAWMTTLLLGASAGEPDAETAAFELENAFVRLATDVDVPATEAGLLVQVSVREGQRVKQGDVLAQLDDNAQRLMLDRVKVELAKKQQEASNELHIQVAAKVNELAAAELLRAEKSAQRQPGSVTQAEFDRLRLTLDRSQLELQQAEFEREIALFDTKILERDVQLAEVALARRRIIAPLDGQVVEVHRSGGEWIEPGQALLRLVDLNRLRVEGFASEPLAEHEFEGRAAKVTVEIDGRNETISGKVTFVSPEIHPVNGNQRIWVEVANRNGLLRPGLRANVTILRERS